MPMFIQPFHRSFFCVWLHASLLFLGVLLYYTARLHRAFQSVSGPELWRYGGRTLNLLACPWIPYQARGAVLHDEGTEAGNVDPPRPPFPKPAPRGPPISPPLLPPARPVQATLRRSPSCSGALPRGRRKSAFE